MGAGAARLCFGAGAASAAASSSSEASGADAPDRPWKRSCRPSETPAPPAAQAPTLPACASSQGQRRRHAPASEVDAAAAARAFLPVPPEAPPPDALPLHGCDSPHAPLSGRRHNRQRVTNTASRPVNASEGHRNARRLALPTSRLLPHKSQRAASRHAPVWICPPAPACAAPCGRQLR